MKTRARRQRDRAASSHAALVAALIFGTVALAACGSSSSSKGASASASASDPIDAIHTCLQAAGYSEFHFAGPVGNRNTVTVTAPSSVVQVYLAHSPADAAQEAISDSEGGKLYAKAQGRILVFADAAPIPSAADQAKIDRCAFSVPAAAAGGVSTVQARATAVLACLTRNKLDAAVEDTAVRGTPTDGVQIMIFSPTAGVDVYPDAADAATAANVERRAYAGFGGTAGRHGTDVVSTLRGAPPKTLATIERCALTGA